MAGEDPFGGIDPGRARAYLAEAAAALAADTGAAVDAWVRAAVMARVSAWGRLEDAALPHVEADLAAVAAEAGAAARLAVEEIAHDPDVLRPGRKGPLEVVADLYVHPSGVLERAGLPAVARDEFERRHFPDDIYGLRIHRFQDLPGGDDLAVLHALWGAAKAAALKRP